MAPKFSGIYLGRNKWFKDSFGYGFITIHKVGAFDEIVPDDLHAPDSQEEHGSSQDPPLVVPDDPDEMISDEELAKSVMCHKAASHSEDPPVRKVGDDIFVYHTDIVPSQSTYKTLVKGEYVQFRLSRGAKDVQAVDVRGVFGGPLLCDSINVRSLNRTIDGRGPAVLQNGDIVYQPGEDAVL